MIVGVSRLGGFLSDMINGISDWLTEAINGFLNIIPLFGFAIWKAIASIVDIILVLFRMLAGLSGGIVYAENSANVKSTGNIVLDFMQSEAVWGTFYKMIIVAVVLLFITTFVAIVRTEYSTEGAQNAKGPIIGKAIKALITLIFIPVVCLVGIMFSNELIKTIDGALGGNQTKGLASNVFLACSYNSNRFRTDDKFKTQFSEMLLKNYKADDEQWVAVLQELGINYGNASTIPWDEVANKIDKMFAGEDTLLPNKVEYIISGLDSVEGTTLFTHQKYNGNIENGQVKFGSFLDVSNTDQVWFFYDLWEFEWMMAFIAIVVIAYVFFMLLLGMAQRLIEICILFVVSPPIVALMPLDNGGAFKEWVKMFMGKVLLVYAPIVAMNIYIMLIPAITSINITASLVSAVNVSNGATVGMAISNTAIPAAILLAPYMLVFINSFLQLVLLIAFSIAVKGSIGWLGKLIGVNENALSNGENLTKQSVGSAMAVGATPISAFRTAKAGIKTVGEKIMEKNADRNRKKAEKTGDLEMAEKYATIAKTHKERGNQRLKEFGANRKATSSNISRIVNNKGDVSIGGAVKQFDKTANYDEEKKYVADEYGQSIKDEKAAKKEWSNASNIWSTLDKVNANKERYKTAEGQKALQKLLTKNLGSSQMKNYAASNGFDFTNEDGSISGDKVFNAINKDGINKSIQLRNNAEDKYNNSKNIRKNLGKDYDALNNAQTHGGVNYSSDWGMSGDGDDRHGINLGARTAERVRSEIKADAAAKAEADVLKSIETITRSSGGSGSVQYAGTSSSGGSPTGGNTTTGGNSQKMPDLNLSDASIRKVEEAVAKGVDAGLKKMKSKPGRES